MIFYELNNNPKDKVQGLSCVMGNTAHWGYLNYVNCYGYRRVTACIGRTEFRFTAHNITVYLFGMPSHYNICIHYLLITTEKI